MCLVGDGPKQAAVPDENRAADAARDAVDARRRQAQGFGASIVGGANPGQPSIARKMLFGQ